MRFFDRIYAWYISNFGVMASGEGEHAESGGYTTTHDKYVHLLELIKIPLVSDDEILDKLLLLIPEAADSTEIDMYGVLVCLQYRRSDAYMRFKQIFRKAIFEGLSDMGHNPEHLRRQMQNLQ